VQAQGGKVAGQSRVGTGNTFTAWLPWRSPEADPEVSQPAQTGGDWSRAWRSRPRIPASQRSG
jgi:hypothetical protein